MAQPQHDHPILSAVATMAHGRFYLSPGTAQTSKFQPHGGATMTADVNWWLVRSISWWVNLNVKFRLIIDDLAHELPQIVHGQVDLIENWWWVADELPIELNNIRCGSNC